jgi:hypothetical protein
MTVTITSLHLLQRLVPKPSSGYGPRCLYVLIQISCSSVFDHKPYTEIIFVSYKVLRFRLFVLFSISN